jgi:hypothetical protein
MTGFELLPIIRRRYIVGGGCMWTADEPCEGSHSGPGMRDPSLQAACAH